MTDDLKKLAEAAEAVATGPWESDSEKMTDAPYQHYEYVLFDAKGNRLLDTANSDPGFGLIEDEHDEDGYRAWNEPARVLMAYLVAAQPAAVLNLLRERDEARKQVDGFRLSQSLDKDSAYVIRELLDRHNVPAAAFIDDHVANAIAQRDAAEAALSAEREEVERLLSAMDREEAYLHRMIDASEENGGIMHGDLEGAFHRIRDKDSDTSTGEEYELGPDLQWRRIEASGTNEKGAG